LGILNSAPLAFGTEEAVDSRARRSRRKRTGNELEWMLVGLTFLTVTWMVAAL
jgi:hypothetical protein